MVVMCTPTGREEYKELKEWDPWDLPLPMAESVFLWEEALGVPMACPEAGGTSGQEDWDGEALPPKRWSRLQLASQGSAFHAMRGWGHKVAPDPRLGPSSERTVLRDGELEKG